MNIEMNVDMVNITKNLSTIQKQVSDKSFSNILSRDAKASSNNSDFQNEVNQVNEIARCMNNDNLTTNVLDANNNDNLNIKGNSNKKVFANLNNQKSLMNSVNSSKNSVKVINSCKNEIKTGFNNKQLTDIDNISMDEDVIEVDASTINKVDNSLKIDSSIIEQIETLVKDKINDLDDKDANDVLEVVLSMIQSLFVNNSEQVIDSDNTGEVNNVFEMLVNNIELGNNNELDIQDDNIEIAKDVTNNFVNELVELLESNNVSISDEELSSIKDKINNLETLINGKSGEIKNSIDFEKINNETKDIEIINELANDMNNKEMSSEDSKKEVNNQVINKTSDYVKTQESKTSNIEDNNESSLLNQDEADKQFDKEDKLLKSILNDGNDNSTIINRFSQITSNQTNNINASKENVVVAYTTKETMEEDIIKELKYMNSNGVKDLLVRINPKELGEIAIKIVQEDGHMKAILKASSKETYTLLSQQSDQMKEQLKNNGIKIQNVDISLYEEDTTYFKGEGFSKQNFSSRHNNSSNNASAKNDVIINEDDFKEDSIIEDLNNLNILV